MPARENGGTSACAITSAARTRPFASLRRIVSILSSGAPVASRMARAASSEITSPNGRILACGISARQLAHQVPELGQEKLGHAEANRVFRSWQRDDDLALRGTRARAGQHCRRSNLLVAQHAEELAESLETFLEQIAYDLVCRIARCDAGAACRDDDLRRRSIQLLLQCRANRFRIVTDDRATGHLVAVGLQQFGNGDAARIVCRHPRIANRQDVTAHRRWRRGLMVEVTHDRSRGYRGSRRWRAEFPYVTYAAYAPSDPYVKLKGQFPRP